MSRYQVKIEVDNGVIVCNMKDGKVKGGNVQAGQGDKFHFVGNGVKFLLAFATFPDGVAESPFNESLPSSPCPEFSGTIKNVVKLPVYYKYTVSVAGAPPLDPIIIVDK
jgi:hypothetical protein